MEHTHSNHTMTSVAPKRKFKDFIPLIVIFSTIILFTALMQIFIGGTDLEFGMRMFMGSFFAIFSAFKIFNLSKFAEAYPLYDIIAKRSRVYAYLYPFLELTLAVLYFSDFGGIARDIFTFALMSVSAIGVIQKLRLKEEIPCACLGMVFILPMTWVTLFEDILMALEALIMVLMPLGFHIIVLTKIEYVLGLHLQIHSSADWLKFSEQGHWVIGAILLILVVSSIIEGKRFMRQSFLRFLAPTLLILMGFGLSAVDAISHAILNSASAVGTLLLQPSSQFFQHFVGGALFLIAGVAEFNKYRYGKRYPWLQYIVPLVVTIAGVGFFFHQQLGALPSVVSAMYWHMSFGVLLIVGGMMRILDLLLLKEKRGFFIIWVITILIASFMMGTYREPDGAYEPSTEQERKAFQIELDALQNKWELF